MHDTQHSICRNMGHIHVVLSLVLLSAETSVVSIYFMCVIQWGWWVHSKYIADELTLTDAGTVVCSLGVTLVYSYRQARAAVLVYCKVQIYCTQTPTISIIDWLLHTLTRSTEIECWRDQMFIMELWLWER